MGVSLHPCPLYIAMNRISLLRGITDQAIDEALASLKLGISKGKPALFKPLLLLYMLGRYWHNATRLLHFRDICEPFKMLLQAFCGPHLHSEDTMYPFWHMRKTSQLIWTVQGEETVTKWYGSPPRPAIQDARRQTSALRGGLTEEVYRRIINDKVRMLEIVFIILKKYFPVALHTPLLEAIEIPSSPGGQQSYSNIVLANYHYSCSICSFPNSLPGAQMHLHVAYLQDPALGGPEASENSLAMCSQHKALLDIGAFTLSGGGEILVADYFKERGSPSFLLSYDGKDAVLPKNRSDRPSPRYCSWHKEHVFMSSTVA